MKIKLYAAVAVLVLLPAPAAAAAGPAGEWPQAGFGPGNTHYNEREKRLNASTIGRISQRWTLATHSSSRCEVGSEPVVSGGRLFSTDAGGIGAYHAATGRRQWHVALPSTTVRRLAIADGKLIVLSSECKVPVAYESRLTAYEPGSGSRLWSTGLRKFSYDLRIDKGIAVLDSNQDGLASTIAYRVGDGKLHWLRKGERGDGLVSAGGRVLLRRATGGARAVSVTTGETLWATDANWYAIGADPDGKRFYIDGPGLSAVDAATGRMIWTSKWHASQVTTDRDHVFYSHDRSVVSLGAATGRKLFSVHTPQVAGCAVRAGGLLYAATGSRGPLVVADAATGKTRMSPVAETTTNLDHPPVVAGGWLYVTDGDLLRAYY